MALLKLTDFVLENPKIVLLENRMMELVVEKRGKQIRTKEEV
jgi:hypothetical protein